MRKNVVSFFIIIFLFSFNFAHQVLAAKGARSFDHSRIKVVMSPLSAANELLDAMKWELAYEKARTQEIQNLLQSIDGDALKDLTDLQKKQVLNLMQEIVIKQMIEDKDYFRKRVVSEYAEFFTYDELQKLTKYFNTSLMQMIVNTKIDGKEIDIKTIKTQLAGMKSEERRKIEDVESSYLYTRYLRFQEKVKLKIDRMMVDRLKEVLGFVIDNAPLIVKHIKNNSPLNPIIPVPISNKH